MRSLLFVVLLPLACAHNGPAAPSQPPDLVLRHGRIYTVDSARPWAEAVAFSAGRIVFVGTDAELDAWLGALKPAQSTDLEGKFAMPGFIAGHVHPISAGLEMAELNLGAFETKDEILAAIGAYAKAHPELPWVLGNTWELPVFPAANPQKEWLDALIPDRPALFSGADGHSAWANSKALALAKITKDTPDPEAGRIERNSKGEPSGTLRESAMDLVYQVAPKADTTARADG